MSQNEQTPAQALAEEHGGTWGEHPKFPVVDWQHDVENDYTRSGYWDWVASKVDQDDEESEEG